jgi:hypothetical protein
MLSARGHAYPICARAPPVDSSQFPYSGGTKADAATGELTHGMPVSMARHSMAHGLWGDGGMKRATQ